MNDFQISKLAKIEAIKAEIEAMRVHNSTEVRQYDANEFWSRADKLNKIAQETEELLIQKVRDSLTVEFAKNVLEKVKEQFFIELNKEIDGMEEIVDNVLQNQQMKEAQDVVKEFGL